MVWNILLPYKMLNPDVFKQALRFGVRFGWVPRGPPDPAAGPARPAGAAPSLDPSRSLAHRGLLSRYPGRSDDTWRSPWWASSWAPGPIGKP